MIEVTNTDDVLAFFLGKPLLFKMEIAPDIRSKLFHYAHKTRRLENPCCCRRLALLIVT